MSDQDLLRLYSTRILALAASVPHAGRLAMPDGSARKRAPLCGSSVGVEVTLRDGRVDGFAQEVRACALGQAAASVVGHAAPGRSLDEVRAGRAALWAMLREDGPAPAAPFDGLAALMPARDHANRHGSIMLAFEALVAAIEDAEKKKAAAAPEGTATAE